MHAPGLIVAAALLTVLFSGTTPTVAQPLQPAPASTPQLAPVSIEDAVLQAASALFSKAVLPPDTGEKLRVVIDPLVDGVTGAQSLATQSVERAVVEFVRSSHPRFEIVPFSADALETASLLFIGTFTPVSKDAQASSPKDAYRVWFTLIDIKSRKIISKARSLALPNGVDPSPSASFGDSPVWTKDRAVEAYIRSCEGKKLGDLVDASFLDGIQSAAYVAEAMRAYDAKRYEEALELYEKAARTNGGDQLRVHNGIYLANYKLNRLREAEEAFGRVVDFSLANNRLAVKFLFRPGSIEFFENANMTTPYRMWLGQIVRRAEKSDACLTLVGHASRTGPESFNDRLSRDRAEALLATLRSQAPLLSPRLTATGVGFRETLVGTGRDDASDALDRRVEFKITPCAEPAGSSAVSPKRQDVTDRKEGRISALR
jgi:outer membrane protein OmpA-like peptidoglycan-associated protein